MSHDQPLTPDQLHALLTKVPHPVRMDDILRLLGAKRRRKTEVLDLLTALTREGRVVRLSGGRWAAAQSVRSVVGTLSLQPRSGTAWVSPLSPEALAALEAGQDAGQDVAQEAEQEAGQNVGQDAFDDLEPSASMEDSAPGQIDPDQMIDPGQTTVQTPAQADDASPPRPLRPAISADIFIDPADLNDAWHGDVVEVALTRTTSRGKGRGDARKPEGRVIRIVRRETTEFVVRADGARTPRGLLCRPLDDHYPLHLDVDLTALPQPPDRHELLVVRVDTHLGRDLWQATALRAIGSEHSVEGQERLVRLHLHIPEVFPPDVLHAASQLEQAPPAPIPCADTASAPLTRTGPERRDLRQLPLVTIDGPDARDFDDAVCVEKTPDGQYVLWVAIADVSHYVRDSSGRTPGLPSTRAIDAEARRRGTSVYFPRSVIPMLPEVLCNNLCSLRPDEERPVMVARMVFSPTGEPGKAAFYPGLMRSRARLTYETVQALLDNQPLPAPLPDAIPPMLHCAAELAGILIRRRSERGGLDLDLPEAGFDFDDAGQLTGMRLRERLFSHRLIEAFMLAANEAVATFLLHKRLSFPLRVHPAPQPERVQTLFRTLRSMGVTLPPAAHKAETSPTGIPGGLARLLGEVLTAAKDSPEAPVVNRLTLRTLMQARYAQAPLSPEEQIHFGLASAAYCHFTSPIRRYPDLLVHRALKTALRTDATPASPSKRTLKNLIWQCEGYNLTERRATEAEREIHRRLACMVLAPRVGEVFTALIVSVNHFGLFVEPHGLPVDGLVRVDTLPDDWYEFDEDRQELIGQGRGLRFRLGQTVRVRLANVTLDRLEVDFVLEEVDMSRAGRSPRAGGPARERANGNTARPARSGQPGERTPPRRTRGGEGGRDEAPSGKRGTPRPGRKSGTRKGEQAGSGRSGSRTGSGHGGSRAGSRAGKRGR